MTDESKQPGLQFGQVFVSEAHFSHRDGPLGGPATVTPGELPLELLVRSYDTTDDRVAALSVRVQTKDDVPSHYVLQVEVTAVVGAVPGEENIPPKDYVRMNGAAALYPFLREIVANLTMRGRHGAVYLKPLNFTTAQMRAVEEKAPAAMLPAALPAVQKKRDERKRSAKKARGTR